MAGLPPFLPVSLLPFSEDPRSTRRSQQGTIRKYPQMEEGGLQEQIQEEKPKARRSALTGLALGGEASRPLEWEKGERTREPRESRMGRASLCQALAV